MLAGENVSPLARQAKHARQAARRAAEVWERNDTHHNAAMMCEAVRRAEAKDALLALMEPESWAKHVDWVFRSTPETVMMRAKMAARREAS